MRQINWTKPVTTDDSPDHYQAKYGPYALQICSVAADQYRLLIDHESHPTGRTRRQVYSDDFCYLASAFHQVGALMEKWMGQAPDQTIEGRPWYSWIVACNMEWDDQWTAAVPSHITGSHPFTRFAVVRWNDEQYNLALATQSYMNGRVHLARAQTNELEHWAAATSTQKAVDELLQWIANQT